jgi:2TM domain
MKDWSLAHRQRGFNIRAVAFLATLLTALNLWLGAPYWILWVLLGWGIGLFAHWFFVLGPGTNEVA